MSALKKGVVIDVPAWKVPVIARKKLLSQPEIAVDVKFAPDEVKDMPDKQFKAFEASFEKGFTPAFQKMSNSWFSDMQKTIDTTEAALEKLTEDAKKSKKKVEADKLKAFMQKIVDKTNAALVAKCKKWTDIVRKLAEKAYNAAVTASYKAMKQKVRKAKIKMIAKVTLFVALTLTAAAVTIAVSVVTMGAGAALAPVVIAGIMTAGKALFGSASEVLKSYDVLKTTIAKVEKDAANLDSAAKAFNKAMQKTAGKVDKAKAFHKALSGDLKSLDKHVGQLDKFIAVANGKTKKQLAQIQDLADALAKAKSDSPEAAAMEKNVLKAQIVFDEAAEQLGNIQKVKATAAEAKAAFQKVDPDRLTKALGKLAPVLSKLNSASAKVKKYAPMLKTIAKGIQEIKAA